MSFGSDPVLLLLLLLLLLFCHFVLRSDNSDSQNSLSKFFENYLHNLGHYLAHNENSSLPLAGFLEEHPLVLDILDTCCLLLRLFADRRNRTSAYTLKLADWS